MKEFLASRTAYYIGFGMLYGLVYLITSFEATAIVCFGAIIGEQAYRQKQDERNGRDD